MRLPIGYDIFKKLIDNKHLRNRLIKEVQNIYILIKHNNMQEYLDKYPKDILARVSLKLCRPFGVSTDVIIRRVEIENLWPPK